MSAPQKLGKVGPVVTQSSQGTRQSAASSSSSSSASSLSTHAAQGPEFSSEDYYSRQTDRETLFDTTLSILSLPIGRDSYYCFASKEALQQFCLTYTENPSRYNSIWKFEQVLCGSGGGDKKISFINFVRPEVKHAIVQAIKERALLGTFGISDFLRLINYQGYGDLDVLKAEIIKDNSPLLNLACCALLCQCLENGCDFAERDLSSELIEQIKSHDIYIDGVKLYVAMVIYMRQFKNS